MCVSCRGYWYMSSYVRRTKKVLCLGGESSDGGKMKTAMLYVLVTQTIAMCDFSIG